MAIIEAPDINNFKPVDSYRALGVGYVTMINPDGVRLDLSEAGAEAADSDPDIAGLLTRMGVLITENGGYKSVDTVEKAEPGQILRVGMSLRDTIRYGYGKVHLSSVYHPEAAPSAIVKAYDFDRRSAGFQFYLGAWLHGRLARASDGLDSPAQLAMFRTSRFGHHTTVMDHMPGSNLHNLYGHMRVSHDRQDVDRAIDEARNVVLDKINKIGGLRGRIIANDLRNVANIIVTDPESVTPENLLDRQLSVIDQPVVSKSNLPLQAIARHMPVLNDGLLRQGSYEGLRSSN